jgi:mevalonate kinase
MVINKHKKHVTASAPGKIMLSVGYAVVHGYPTIVTAVNQRLFATVTKNGVDVFHLDAPDLGLTSYTKDISELGKKDLPKAVRFIEILYKNFLEAHPQKEGIIVTTRSDFSSDYGFGSSSAVTVAFAKALTTLYKVKLSNEELFNLCYQAVIEVQGVGSGYDLAAAIWGGTLYFVSPAKIVKKLNTKKLPLIIAYSGEKADTPTLVRLVDNKLDKQPKKIDTIFKRIAKIADDFELSAKIGDWQKIGDLFNQSQECARELGVSNNTLENLISSALDAGAYGATSSGAAGGDCIVAIAEPEKRLNIIKAIQKMGGKIIDVEINADGVRIEKTFEK